MQIFIRFLFLILLTSFTPYTVADFSSELQQLIHSNLSIEDVYKVANAESTEDSIVDLVYSKIFQRLMQKYPNASPEIIKDKIRHEVSEQVKRVRYFRYMEQPVFGCGYGYGFFPPL